MNNLIINDTNEPNGGLITEANSLIELGQEELDAFKNSGALAGIFSENRCLRLIVKGRIPLNVKSVRLLALDKIRELVTAGFLSEYMIQYHQDDSYFIFPPKEAWALHHALLAGAIPCVPLRNYTDFINRAKLAENWLISTGNVFVKGPFELASPARWLGNGHDYQELFDVALDDCPDGLLYFMEANRAGRSFCAMGVDGRAYLVYLHARANEGNGSDQN
jgi:hypothetical protein